MERSRVINEKRDTAQRTRRLAYALSSLEDRTNLLGFAQELDEEVARLERERAADPAPQPNVDSGL